MQNERNYTDVADEVTGSSALIVLPYYNHTWTVAHCKQCWLDTRMLSN